MRRSGVWHPRLAHLIAGMGHGDLLVVADPGLPVPAGVEIVDLVYARGEPALLSVLRAVLGELVVEAAVLADELTDAKLVADLAGQLGEIPVTRVPHDEFKATAGTARVVVRTGEDTPYANIGLRAGVPF